MVKRKAKVYLDAGSEVEAISFGLGPAEVPAGLETNVAEGLPTGTGSTLGSTTGVSANQEAKGAADVASGEASGIDRFWLILEQVGYQAW